ncbi:putative ATP binding protein [Toxoplasma gondii FOU]|uniref:GPN-loop GTPase 2 n=1 Tax=Toxoplasma gondii FOU TaxID=943167 RepID=A0A086L8B2_TOXGO|nr:putative ATP binding protein [Toxoplasma gondii FOU]
MYVLVCVHACVERPLHIVSGLLYCLEYLLVNIDWLTEKLTRDFKDHYILLDCPGQVEVYTHHECMQRIVQRLQKDLDARLRNALLGRGFIAHVCVSESTVLFCVIVFAAHSCPSRRQHPLHGRLQVPSSSP